MEPDPDAVIIYGYRQDTDLPAMSEDTEYMEPDPVKVIIYGYRQDTDLPAVSEDTEDMEPDPDTAIIYGDTQDTGGDIGGWRVLFLSRIYSGMKTGDDPFSRDVFQETLWRQNNIQTFKKVKCHY